MSGLLKYLPASLRTNSERTTFLALAGCISLVQVSIAASQILLAVVIVGFIWMLMRRESPLMWPVPLMPPLFAFMAWTLIASFASPNIMLALTATRKFYLLLLVLLVPSILRGEGRFAWICRAVFAVAGISALWGLVQFVSDPERDLLHRIKGSMSQWMTYSGLLMLALMLLTAYVLCAGLRRHKWVIPVAALIVLALIFSLTRNAWAGGIAGIMVLILMRRPRAIVFVFAAILVLYAVSPGLIKRRVKSIVDTTDPRFYVYMTALHVIHDNPWFGVGPKNVKYEAPKYRDEKNFPEALKKVIALVSDPLKYREEEKKYPDWLYQHMHNNLFEIAAEDGIPGLILWLWLMIRLVWDALRCYRHASGTSFSLEEGSRSEALIASSAAIAAWVALMIAGLVEYNFGDSEVLTFFLFVASAPYAFLPQRAGVVPSQFQQTSISSVSPSDRG